MHTLTSLVVLFSLAGVLLGDPQSDDPDTPETTDGDRRQLDTTTDGADTAEPPPPQPVDVRTVLQAFEQTILDSEANTTHQTAANDDVTTSDNPVDLSANNSNVAGEPGINSSYSSSAGSGGGESSGVVRPRLHCISDTTTTADDDNDDLSTWARVHVVNGTELQLRLSEEHNANVTNRTFPAVCSITLFYGSWCNFSAKAAPHYNALPRYYPSIKMYAIEATNNINILAQYGVIALPSILVFHNSRPMFMFNTTEHSLESYVQFLTPLTGVAPRQIPLSLTEEDLTGPVPTTAVAQFNYNLLLATLFTLACAVVNLSKSTYIGSVVDNLRNAWREVEIQHEHAD